MGHRLGAIASLRAISERSEGAQDRWVSALPHDIPEKGANYSLMRGVAVNLSYEDRQLTPDLLRGLPNAGYAPPR